jgi:putative ABC transport system permease protein
VFKARTVAISLVVGVGITLVAALRPALRATRVPPVSAVREGAVLPPSRLARFSLRFALSSMVLALGLMLVGALLSSGSTTLRLLMIGLALVTVVGVLAAGLKTQFRSGVDQAFVANYAVTATNNFSPIGVASENALRRVPGVLMDSGVRAAEARVFGKRINLTAVDPDVCQVISIKWAHGSPQIPAQLGSDGAFVSQDYATAHHLQVGSPLALETPRGRMLHLVPRGITNPAKNASPYGDVTISTALFDRSYQNPQNLFTLVNIAGGVSPANTARLNAALAGFPDAKLQTKQQFIDNQVSGLSTLLNLLYVLLSLSIVISLFGTVNTLVLTVFERTRELGMLRAVGISRRQLRRMIRHESVITALLGATLGIPFGVLVALMVGAAIKYSAFTVPVGTLVVFVIAAILAGIVAAIFPARRAGRLNVLDALQYE